MNEQIPSEPAPFYTLLSNPGRFFAWAAHRMPLSILLLPVLFVSLARTVSRVMLRFETRGIPEILHHWGMFWVVSIIAAFISAPIYYFVFASWYWIRLKIVGVKGPVYHKGARIYFLCSLISSVPLAAIVVWKSIAYASPSDAVSNTADYTIAQYSLNAFILWSAIASYLGVQAAFRPKRQVLTAMLFLVLPLLATIAAAILLFLGMIALQGTGLMPA